jgi:hypothetical protein
MAGTAQAYRSGRHASGGPSGCRHNLGIGQFAVIQSVATSVGVDVSAINVRDASEIEGEIADFARTSNGGLWQARWRTLIAT